MRMTGILFLLSLISFHSGGGALQAQSPSGIPEKDMRFEDQDNGDYSSEAFHLIFLQQTFYSNRIRLARGTGPL